MVKIKILKNWDSVLQALILIRLGQELGSDTKYAHLIHDAIEFLLHLIK